MIWCTHQAMPDEVDRDGRRICPTCGDVFGPPSDIASDLALGYLAVLRQGYDGRTRENTDEELERAVRWLR